MTYKADGDAAVNPIEVSYLFKVLIGGEAIGDFQAVENFERKIQPHEYKEGGRNHAPHQLYNPPSYGEVTLKWGLVERDPLWAWMEEVQIGADFRKEVQIFQLSRDLTKARRTITLQRAWPISWKGVNLDVDASKLAVEELRLVFDSMTMKAKDEEGAAG